MRRKILLWISVILLMPLAAWLLRWAASGEKEVRTAKFPDGQIVRIEAVTFGKEHMHGSVWERVLTGMLPTNLTAQLGIRVTRYTRPEDVLVVWMRSNTNNAYGAMVALDDQGHEGCPAGARLLNNRQTLFEISWFPRRSRILKLRNYQMNVGKRTDFVDFQIKNPAYKVYPEWTPEPLPITKRVGDEQFSLTAFHTGLYATGLLADMDATWTELEFRNGPPDAPTGPWQPFNVSIRDASGNLKQEREPRGIMAADGEALKAIVARNPTHDWRAISEAGMFWLDEPAWKIDVTWSRILGFPFPPEQLWTIKGVTNPAPRTFIQIEAKTNTPTGSLLFRGMSAAQTAFPGERAFPAPAIHVKFASTDTNALANLIRVTDDRGSNVVFTPPPNGFLPRVYQLPRLTTNSKTLDFTFALHRKYQVEFLAKPSLLHTNIQKNF